MEILLDHDDIVCMASGRVVVARWQGRVTMEAIDAAEVVLHAFYERTNEPFIEIVVVKAGVPLPEKAARTRLATFMRRLERRLRATAFAYEGNGVGAIAIRAAASGIVSLSNAVIPSLIVAAPEEAIPWLVRNKHISPGDGEQLKADLAAFRSRGH